MSKKNWRPKGKDATEAKDSGKTPSSSAFKPKRRYQNNNRKKPANYANSKERWDDIADKQPARNNDASWYNRFTDQVRDWANFNFNQPVGSRTNWGTTSGWDEDRLPGVMSIYFAPAFGSHLDAGVSPLNMAANRLYQFTRFDNNGSSRYDRGDLMLYYLAMDSCYMFHSYLRRLYGILTQYSTINRYYPEALIRANRCDFEDLRKHIPDLRAYTNEYAHRLSMLPIPNSMPYLMRHVWMCDNVWCDENSAKCQFYMFVPLYFSKFGIEDESSPYVGQPYLDLVQPTYDTRLKFADLIAFGDQLLTPLVENEDFNLIGADVLKAFGSNGLYMADVVPEDYTVLPMYSEEVLDQIENACCVGHPTCIALGDGSVKNRGHAVYWDADSNRLVPYTATWVPYDVTNTAQLSHRPFIGNRLVNLERDTITRDDIMVATRLTCTAKSFGTEGDHYYLNLRGIGSEIVTNCTVYFWTSYPDGTDHPFRLGTTYPIYYGQPLPSVQPYAPSGASATTLMDNISAASNFMPVVMQASNRQIANLDYFSRHPSVMLYSLREYVKMGSDGSPVVQSLSSSETLIAQTIHRLGDVDNYAFFTAEDLENLAQVALTSEFYVPLKAEGSLHVGG